jgi:hypothetical protein
MRQLMSTLSNRVVEAVNAAKERGHSIAGIAARCGISVQAVYQWIDPMNSLKEIKATSLMGLSDLSGFSPWYINDGSGDKNIYFAKTEPQKALIKITDLMLLEQQETLARMGIRLLNRPKEQMENNVIRLKFEKD